MARQRLYMVHAMGNDAVGLVGAVTTPIAESGGNIVDLRQDVLHGLFSLYMVVDLSESSLLINDFKKVLGRISEETGLELAVEKYVPVARNPEKVNMLAILIGSDKPGIIASVSQTLARYKVNIELSSTIAREGIFLMELLTDISSCAIPLHNLKKVLTEQMAAMSIKTIFQTEDVFNKRKRVILFDIASSLISDTQRGEILAQTGVDTRLAQTYSPEDPAACVRNAAGLLEGFPLEVMSTIVDSATIAPGTMELLQTLRIMGYKIALVTNGLSPAIEALGRRLGVDYCYGRAVEVNDDDRAMTGEVGDEVFDAGRLERIIDTVVARETVAREDLTVISDTDIPPTPGIRLDLDLGVLLDLYNKHAVSEDNVVGLLGAWGIPGTAK